MSSHTPTPWALDKDGCIFAGGNRFDMLKLYTGWVEEAWLGDAEALANAEFIVRACNGHADLVAALENFLDNPRMLTETERVAFGRTALLAAQPTQETKNAG